MELKHKGEIDWDDFKMKLKWHCMEQELGPRTEWPTYDEMNARVLPSHRKLWERGEHIVKKRNGLFIEKIPPEMRGLSVNGLGLRFGIARHLSTVLQDTYHIPRC